MSPSGLLVSLKNDSVTTEADLRYLEGRVRLREGRLGDSLVALSSCLAADPDHVLAHYLLGGLYAQVGLTDLASEQWATCLRIRPDFGPARRDLERLRETERQIREQLDKQQRP